MQETDCDAANDSRLLTAHEVADLLAVRVSWVRENTRNGRLPNIMLGRYRRYRREAILEWVAEHEIHTRSK